jgi:HlyD family secretion protein
VLSYCCLLTLLSGCHPSPKRYNAYIDADLTYLSSDFGGRLSALNVIRGQLVPKDLLVFKLEQTSEQYHVDMSSFNQKKLKAQRQEIINQLHFNDINFKRILRMRKDNAASQTDLDAATRDLNISKNQLTALDYQISNATVDTKDNAWRVIHKEAKTPDAGLIYDTYYTAEEYVPAGQPVVSFLSKKNIKVVFFVAEPELSQVELNANVTISSDGSPFLAKGKISYISRIAQYTPPIIFSRENRQKLVFRVEARLDEPELNKVHLGLPVTLEFVS